MMDAIKAKLAYLTRPGRDVTLLNVQTDDGDFHRYLLTDEQISVMIAVGMSRIVDEIARRRREAT